MWLSLVTMKRTVESITVDHYQDFYELLQKIGQLVCSLSKFSFFVLFS